MSRLLADRLVAPRLVAPRLAGGPGSLVVVVPPVVLGAIKIADRVSETTTTSGTGTIDLDGAIAGYQSFVDGIGDNTKTYYAIVSSTDGRWETGVGTVLKGTGGTPNRLTRDSVIDGSSGAGVTVNFAVSTTPKDVFCTVVASKLMYNDKVLVGQIADADYGPTVTIDASLGNVFTVSVANTTAWTLAVTNPSIGQEINLQIRNASGGVAGTVTFPSNFRLAGAWVNAATGYNRALTLFYHASGVWYEVHRSAADVPN